MRKRIGLWLIGFAVMLSGCVGTRLAFPQAPAAQYHKSGAAVIQDWAITPGAVDRTLTEAVLCDPAHHTAEDRHVTQSLKVKVCRAYGITEGCPGAGYEIDHLVSIELGGSNDIGNLWPQPIDAPGVVGFHTKDVVENRAHAAVCRGRLSLVKAQALIASDWYQFGKDQGFLPPGK